MSEEKEVAEFIQQRVKALNRNGITFSASPFAETLFNCTVDGVVGFDLNYRITIWNRNMELHYNKQRAEAVGRSVTDLVPELNNLPLLEEVMEGKNIFLKDNPYRHRPGNFQAYISPVRDSNDKIIGGIAVIHDNTEIKQALDKIKKQNEELLKRNEELRQEILIRQKAEEELKLAHNHLEERVILRTAQLSETNRELNEFAYVISHDLKAPLRGISSLSEWIATDYSHLLDDTGKKSMDLLRSSVKRMDQLIKGVLSYYRMSKTAEETEVNTNCMVNDIVKQLRPPAHITFHVDDLPKVFTEEVPFYQVFQNLLDNAIKYNDKAQGEVRISSTRLKKEWQFSVSDNGPGIANEEKERVFVLFQTGPGNNASDSTGIGLAVVKKIVTRLGGNIWLNSEPGKGTTFHFTIPFKN